jgi:hypothetical protein
MELKLHPTGLAEALALFKHATTELRRLWDIKDADIFGDTYPKFLPDFDEFYCEVMEMEFQTPAPDLPDLPPVGTIVRARYDFSPDGSRVWKQGWTGEVIHIGEDHVSVEAHRYLGPGWHEWDNCRVFTLHDGMFAYENTLDRSADGQDKFKLMALALNQEFEVIS